MGTLRPRSHEIDTKATIVLQRALHGWAVLQSHSPDYAIDYTAEVFEQGLDGTKRAAGLDFQIQQKGTENLILRGTTVVFTLGCDDLAHYLDNKLLPVFLCVIDVATERGYWLFLQRYAKESLHDHWRKKKTVTLHIPQSNEIRDAAGFKNAVADAHRWMRELRPGSPSSALAVERKRLETLDPRLHVKLSATENGVHIEAFAKELVNINLRVEGPEDARQAFREKVGFGQRVDPAEIGVRAFVSGSPVIETPIIRAFQYGMTRSGVLSFFRVREGAVVRLDIPTTLAAGDIGGHCDVQIGTSLVKLRVLFDLRPQFLGQLTFEWEASIEEWAGRVVGDQLPAFRTMLPVFGDVRDDDQLGIAISCEGLELFRCKIEGELRDRTMRLMCFVPVANQLHDIGQAIGHAFEFPSSLSRVEADQLFVAWSFMKGCTVASPGSEIELTIRAPRESVHDLDNLIAPSGTVVVEETHREFDVQSVRLRFERLVTTISVSEVRRTGECVDVDTDFVDVPIRIVANGPCLTKATSPPLVVRAAT